MAENKETIKLEYHKAKMSRRSLAFILDVLLMSVIALGAFVGLRAAVENSPTYVQAFEDFTSISKNSRLYTYSETEDNLVMLDVYVKGAYKDDVKEQARVMEEHLTYFYTEDPIDIFDGTEGIELYNAEKVGKSAIVQENGSPYFATSMETGLPVAVVDAETLMNFYSEALISAMVYLNRSETYVNASKTLSQTINIFIIPASIAAALLLYEFLLPLLFTRRGWQTFGMMAMKLSLVDQKAVSPSTLRYFLRWLWILLVETLLSLVTFGVPLFINVGFAFFRKDGQALHDYMTGTYMIDSSEKSVYTSVGEYLVLKQKASETESRGSLTTWFDSAESIPADKKDEQK